MATKMTEKDRVALMTALELMQSPYATGLTSKIYTDLGMHPFKESRQEVIERATSVIASCIVWAHDRIDALEAPKNNEFTDWSFMKDVWEIIKTSVGFVLVRDSNRRLILKEREPDAWAIINAEVATGRWSGEFNRFTGTTPYHRVTEEAHVEKPENDFEYYTVIPDFADTLMQQAKAVEVRDLAAYLFLLNGRKVLVGKLKNPSAYEIIVDAVKGEDFSQVASKMSAFSKRYERKVKKSEPESESETIYALFDDSGKYQGIFSTDPQAIYKALMSLHEHTYDLTVDTDIDGRTGDIQIRISFEEGKKGVDGLPMPKWTWDLKRFVIKPVQETV